MKIAIASDHRGIDYKKAIIEHLKKAHTVIDCSINNTADDDYPDFAFKVCREVVNGNADIGILICRTGIGMAIAANKVKGIRCAKADNVEEAILSRNDNGANVLSFSYEKNIEEAKRIIDAFISADLLNAQRHVRRVNKIIDYENGAYNEL